MRLGSVIGSSRGPARPRVVLVFPPCAPQYTHPELGMPQITAFLRAQGARVEQADLNVRFVHGHLKTPQVLDTALRALSPRMLHAVMRLTVDMEEQAARVRATARTKSSHPLTERETARIVRRFLEHMEGVIPRRGAPEGPVGQAPTNDATTRQAIARRLLEPSSLAWVLWLRFVELLDEDLIQPDGYQAHQIERAVRGSCALLDSFLREELDPLLRTRPLVLGISIHNTRQIVVALRLARMARQIHESVHVVFGGPLLSAALPLLQEDPLFFRHGDAVIPFAGERPMLGVVSALTQGLPIDGVAGVMVERAGRRHFVPEGRRPIPLSSLPLPELDGHDLHLYPERMLPFQTIRGCTWGRCTFCYHVLSSECPGVSPRPRPSMRQALVDKALRFAKEASTRYQVEEMTLADNCLPPRHAVQLSEAFLRHGVRMRWRALARFEEGFSRDVCRLAGRAGCTELLFGLETSDAASLRKLRKGVGPARVLRVLEACSAGGIDTCVFLLSYPGQPLREYQQTLEFLCANHRVVGRAIPQRFELGRSAAVFRNPELLGLRLRPESVTSYLASLLIVGESACRRCS